MKICNNGHEEIVYHPMQLGNPKGCPLCIALNEIKMLRKNIEHYLDLELTVDQHIKLEGIQPC